MREALFEILEAHGADLARVLDLYSGTGAMGIEALSRGAAHCDFVESDAKACEVIRAEPEAARPTRRARRSFRSRSRGPWRRLRGRTRWWSLTRPMSMIGPRRSWRSSSRAGLLAPDGTLVVEHSKRTDWPETLAGRRQLTSRRYGDTALTLYRKEFAS